MFEYTIFLCVILFFFIFQLFSTHEKMSRKTAVLQQCCPRANFISVEHLHFLQALITWKSNLIDFYE